MQTSKKVIDVQVKSAYVSLVRGMTDGFLPESFSNSTDLQMLSTSQKHVSTGLISQGWLIGSASNRER